jgi:GNAT superfamily N-acetyltransferase
MSWTMRAAGPDDAERLNAVRAEGFESYRAFGPPGWQPPDAAAELETLRRRLGSPDVWCLLAEADGEVAGHIAIMPAHQHPEWTTEDTRLAHLWQLFLRTRWHGSGLAAELHAEGVGAARLRGFSEMRLYTPAGQARARRFYEREGWATTGAPVDDSTFGMPLVEYRRAL